VKRKLLVPQLALLGFLAAACGNGHIKPFDVGSAAKASAVSCAKVSAVQDEIDRVVDMSDGKDRAQALAAWNIDPKDTKQVTGALNKRAKACKSNDPGKSGKTAAVQPDGKTVTLPFVNGSPVKDGDTRNDSDTPSLDKLLPNCGVLADWQSLVDCVNKHHAQWYIDGVNQRVAYTGFDWNDIVKWSKATTPDGKKPETRVIQLYKMNMSDDAARRAVAKLVGGMDVAKRLQTPLRYNAPAYANTWRSDGKSPMMTDFADYKQEVRVTLAPLVLDKNGHVVGLLTGVPSGVFVDCYNLHWFFQAVPKTPGTPVPTCSKDLTKNCSPPSHPGCTEGKKCHTPPPGGCKHNCLTPKNPHEAPGNGGAGDGGSGKYGGNGNDRQHADPKPAPPKAGNPPSTYHPPAPPTGGGSGGGGSNNPPPESGANPPDDGGNSGDPGGF
jgi:hypothetical protein